MIYQNESSETDIIVEVEISRDGKQAKIKYILELQNSCSNQIKLSNAQYFKVVAYMEQTNKRANVRTLSFFIATIETSMNMNATAICSGTVRASAGIKRLDVLFQGRGTSDKAYHIFWGAFQTTPLRDEESGF